MNDWQIFETNIKMNDPLIIERLPDGGAKISNLKNGFYLVNEQVAEWLENDELFASLLTPYTWFKVSGPDLLGNCIYWFYHFSI